MEVEAAAPAADSSRASRAGGRGLGVRGRQITSPYMIILTKTYVVVNGLAVWRSGVIICLCGRRRVLPPSVLAAALLLGFRDK